MENGKGYIDFGRRGLSIIIERVIALISGVDSFGHLTVTNGLLTGV